LVTGILGDNPVQLVISGAIKAIMALLSPAIKTTASILDVKQFIPGFMTDVSWLGPLLGLLLFVLFLLNIFPIMMLFFPYKLGLVTGGTTMIMYSLLFASLFSDKIAVGFVMLVEFILNFAFRTVLGNLIPSDSLGSGLKVVLGDKAPDMNALKNSLLDFCYINLLAPPTSKKRTYREMASDTAEHVGPKLKRLKTDPKGAAGDAASATVAAGKSAVIGTRDCCCKVRKHSVSAAGNAASWGVALRGCILTVARSLAEFFRALPGVVKRLPDMVVSCAKSLWFIIKRAFGCGRCCFCMCPEFMIMLIAVAVGMYYVCTSRKVREQKEMLEDWVDDKLR